MSRDLVIRSRRVATTNGVADASIHVREGRVFAVKPHDWPAPDGAEVVDAGDSVVMPGLVDTHVHVNEPGRADWEGFETATKAAAAGGVTTLIDMPLNSLPVTTTPAALKAKRMAAEGRCWVDCGFWGGVVPGNQDELEPLLELGVFGFKAFLVHSGIDEFPNVSEEDLRRAMRILAKHRAPLLVHAELPLDERRTSAGDPRRYAHFLRRRPKAWENAAIDLLIALSLETGCRTHVVHLSSGDALGAIGQARRDGAPLTIETCPHYLAFAAEAVPDGATEFKCCPPIREAENLERLWAGLRDSYIDLVVSDHSPCPPALKGERGDFEKAWGGISSLQFSLPAFWTAARRRKFELRDILFWMSDNPARFAGLVNKGRLELGADADLVVWKPEESFQVTPDLIQHRHKLTPYLGRTLDGVVETTFVRGEKVFDRGRFSSHRPGRLLRRDSGAV